MVRCNTKFISSFHACLSEGRFGAEDRTRLRKGTTEETQTLCARLQKFLEFDNKDDRVYVMQKTWQL
jgi:hypothetical protein